MLLRQRGVLRRVKEAGKVIVEARRNHARAAEDPVKRTGVHAQPLLPEEERYRAAASQGDDVLKGLPCLGQSCCTTCRAWRHLRMRAEAAGCRLLPRGPVWVGGCRARAGRRVARSASLRVGLGARHGREGREECMRKKCNDFLANLMRANAQAVQIKHHTRALSRSPRTIAIPCCHRACTVPGPEGLYFWPSKSAQQLYYPALRCAL